MLGVVEIYLVRNEGIVARILRGRRTLKLDFEPNTVRRILREDLHIIVDSVIVSDLVNEPTQRLKRLTEQAAAIAVDLLLLAILNHDLRIIPSPKSLGQRLSRIRAGSKVWFSPSCEYWHPSPSRASDEDASRRNSSSLNYWLRIPLPVGELFAEGDFFEFAD